MNNYQLYFLHNSESFNPFYIGIGKPGRSKVHVKQLNTNFVKLTNIKIIKMMKMINEGFTILDTIIHDNLSIDQARKLEIFYISLYGRLDKNTGILTNRTSGGEWIYNCPKTDEWKIKMSIIQKNIQNTPEVKQKKSNKLKGQKRSETAINNIRNSQLIESVRRKNSESKLGGKNGMAKSCYYKNKNYGAITEIEKLFNTTRYFIMRDPSFHYT